MDGNDYWVTSKLIFKFSKCSGKYAIEWNTENEVKELILGEMLKNREDIMMVLLQNPKEQKYFNLRHCKRERISELEEK